MGTLLCSLTTWSDGNATESVDDSALWDAVSLSLMTRLVGSLRFFRLYWMALAIPGWSSWIGGGGSSVFWSASALMIIGCGPGRLLAST